MFNLRPKIPIWVCFGGAWNGKCWYILRSLGVIYLRMAIWYNIRPFGIACGRFGTLFPFWYFGQRKIWQPWMRVAIESAALHLHSWLGST
jgi:hypothetical protein